MDFDLPNELQQLHAAKQAAGQGEKRPPPHTTSRIRRAAAGSRGSPSVSWNDPHMSAL